MKKVLIPTKLDSIAAEILRTHGGYAVVQDAKTPLPDLAAAHPDAHALIVRSEKVTAAVMDALPRLRVVVRAGAGYDNVDVKYARKRGVDVMNTPGANANAVAEEVIALMLADARFIVPADASVRRGEWEKKAFMGREITGKTVGIVGLGNIGRLVIRRLRGFECRILGYDPLVTIERAREFGVEPVDLDELFAEADYITLHIPETESTRGLVSAKLLSLMKQNATIVNCARAGIIDEQALREARKSKNLRFLNDVYPKDEPGPKSVADIADILMPHLGASTHEANYVAAERAARELIDLDDKGVTSFIVNRDIPEGLDRTYCELAFSLGKLTRQLAGSAAPLRAVETSFYGQLEPYSRWLLVSILAGVWEDFDRLNDHDAAVKFLAERGIEYNNRPIDSEKGFPNSITVDLVTEISEGRLKRTSVRGTVAEGMLMVARINEFDRLYFPPYGGNLVCMYQDRPGVVAAIAGHLAGAQINIEDMRNPHDLHTNRSLAILRVNKPVPPEVVQALGKDIAALLALYIEL
jgi:D-3-phosphoglycerate dehydrogenase